MSLRVGDIVHRAEPYQRPYHRQPSGRLRVTGFYQWNGAQMARLELLDGSTRYELPEAELVHAEDAVTRLGRLAP